jgi:hypothetical protein
MKTIKVTIPKADVVQPRKFGDTGDVVDKVHQALKAGGIDPTKPFKQNFLPDEQNVEYTQEVPDDQPVPEQPERTQPPPVEVPKDTSIPSEPTPPEATQTPTVETNGAPEEK